ncbi:hypothetical protein V1281_006949 [Nitrobacteraceae bacterium AZCC 2161]
MLTNEIQDLLLRLRGGWSPMADEIAAPQGDLVDWNFLGRDRLRGAYGIVDGERVMKFYSAGDNGLPGRHWAHVSAPVLIIDRRLEWALCQDRLLWLYDAEEGRKIEYLGG